MNSLLFLVKSDYSFILITHHRRLSLYPLGLLGHKYLKLYPFLLGFLVCWNVGLKKYSPRILRVSLAFLAMLNSNFIVSSLSSSFAEFACPPFQRTFSLCVAFVSISFISALMFICFHLVLGLAFPYVI